MQYVCEAETIKCQIPGSGYTHVSRPFGLDACGLWESEDERKTRVCDGSSQAEYGGSECRG